MRDQEQMADRQPSDGVMPAQGRPLPGVWLVFACLLAADAAGLWLGIANREGPNADFSPLLAVPASLCFAAVGALILSRGRAFMVGLLCLFVGSGLALERLASEYAHRALVQVPGSLPAGGAAAWVATWTLALPLPSAALILFFFPTGKLASRAWLPLAWLAALLGAGHVLLLALSPAPLATDWSEKLPASNPFAVPWLPADGPFFDWVFGVMALLVLVAAAGQLARLRGRPGEERQQVKVLLYVCAILMVSASLLLAVHWVNSGPAGASLQALEDFSFLLFVACLMIGIPAAIGVSILRYGLYEIDVVINRTLLYGSLAAFITAVYVLIVVGVGELLYGSASPSLGLSLVATALVAVVFQPARERLQRVANRIVYGRRAAPEEVLEEFSARVAGIYAGEELLRRTARVLAEGTAARQAVVYTCAAGQFEPVAVWPPGTEAPDVTGDLTAAAGFVEINHQGELLGALAVTRSERRLTAVEERLLQDLAAQAGPVLSNVRLTTQLEERLVELSAQEAELRSSRERIVAAQDAERRRLERNIHDGAQQHLVALTVKVRLARALSERDPARAAALLKDLRGELEAAGEVVRALAGGIYPALLQERGPAEALRAAGQTLGIALEVSAAGLRRHAEGLEAGVYFCCLEALQNVAKHAAGAAVVMELEENAGWLRFEVRDDGPGFDATLRGSGSGLTNMVDRIAAMGGRLRVESEPGQGVRVIGSVPADVEELSA